MAIGQGLSTDQGANICADAAGTTVAAAGVSESNITVTVKKSGDKKRQFDTYLILHTHICYTFISFQFMN